MIARGLMAALVFVVAAMAPVAEIRCAELQRRPYGCVAVARAWGAALAKEGWSKSFRIRCVGARTWNIIGPGVDAGSGDWPALVVEELASGDTIACVVYDVADFHPPCIDVMRAKLVASRAQVSVEDVRPGGGWFLFSGSRLESEMMARKDVR